MPLFGRNDQEDNAHQINGMLQNIIEGGYGGRFTSNGFGDPNNLMNFMSNYLSGQAQRAGNQGAKYGAGLAGSQGFANPASMMLRGRSQAFEPFADQFGKLAMQVPQMSQQFRQTDFDNLLKLLTGRQGTTGAMDTGGGWDKMFGTVLGAALAPLTGGASLALSGMLGLPSGGSGGGSAFGSFPNKLG